MLRFLYLKVLANYQIPIHSKGRKAKIRVNRITWYKVDCPKIKSRCLDYYRKTNDYLGYFNL